jgi:hypothetical protein
VVADPFFVLPPPLAELDGDFFVPPEQALIVTAPAASAVP